MTISHADPRLSWQGHLSLEQTAEYTRPWRIPIASKALFPPTLLPAAAMQAGVRLTFHTDSNTLEGDTLPHPEPRTVDLFVDHQLVATLAINPEGHFSAPDLGSGQKLIDLWLPQRTDFALSSLKLDDNATLEPHSDTRPRWITYGSSITHCGSALSPAFTWPGVVARSLNLSHTNLGFGGQCHLDIQMARLIRDTPADFISICAGINIYGNGSLNARSFPSNLIGTVQLIREKHPETPLALISPIHSAPRETAPNIVGWTLVDYRNAVEETAELLRSTGDRNLHYVHGLDLLGEEQDSLMPDQLHPGPEGYILMGENFVRQASKNFFAGLA